MVLELISIKNTIEIKGIKIHIHWQAKTTSSAILPSWQSTVREWKRLSAAYTDVSKSSLEMICWLHDLT